MIRSKLFIPGSRPELFEKAAGSAADALSFDLEDAVAQEKKAEARAPRCIVSETFEQRSRQNYDRARECDHIGDVSCRCGRDCRRERE